jgi:hypothetical protein
MPQDHTSTLRKRPAGPGRPSGLALPPRGYGTRAAQFEKALRGDRLQTGVSARLAPAGHPALSLDPDAIWWLLGKLAGASRPGAYSLRTVCAASASISAAACPLCSDWATGPAGRGHLSSHAPAGLTRASRCSCGEHQSDPPPSIKVTPAPAGRTRAPPGETLAASGDPRARGPDPGRRPRGCTSSPRSERPGSRPWSPNKIPICACIGLGR